MSLAGVELPKAAFQITQNNPDKVREAPHSRGALGKAAFDIACGS
ncbi:hypothetical protein ACVWXM_002091 [Bradyrhizobium sp. GM7.3]